MEMMKVKILAQRFLRPNGKDAFIAQIPRSATVFDIGCGNQSPQRTKEFRLDIHYIGLDIQDYGQTEMSMKFADEYRITRPESFVAEIEKENASVDAVVSSHNLEHCTDQSEVIRAMCKALKPGGRIYLAFPCEESTGFPSRRGTLRFSDDATHVAPPKWLDTLDNLSRCGVKVVVSRRRDRPILPLVIGAMLEPFSFALRRVMPLGSTWALWGFESVVWGEKL